jgi:hypothetical protein
MLYGINLVKTMVDATVRRGAIVKAMAIFTKYHFIDSFKASLLFTLDTYFSNPYIEIISTLYESLNSISPTLLYQPNSIHQSIMCSGIITTVPSINKYKTEYKPSSWIVRKSISYYGNIISVMFPLYTSPDVIDTSDISLLVRVFGKDTMK